VIRKSERVDSRQHRELIGVGPTDEGSDRHGPEGSEIDPSSLVRVGVTQEVARRYPREDRSPRQLRSNRRQIERRLDRETLVLNDGEVRHLEREGRAWVILYDSELESADFGQETSDSPSVGLGIRFVTPVTDDLREAS
jgi:hypothetical protein